MVSTGVYIASQNRAIIIYKSDKTEEEDFASRKGKLWEGKYMRKLMEDKGQLLGLVCVGLFWCHLISSAKVVIPFLNGNGHEEETPLQVEFMFSFQADVGRYLMRDSIS